MFFRFFITNLFLIVFSSQLISAQPNDLEGKMHNAFGHGFKAAEENRNDEAIKFFTEAGNFAKQASIIHGMIDAGNALRNLNQTDQAASFFNAGLDLALQAKDWHQLISLGYAFASLPITTRNTNSAVKSFTEAGKIALNQNDWIGLTESANGLINMNLNKKAEALLDQGLDFVKQAYSLNGCRVIADLYKKLGLLEKVAACKDVEAELNQYKDDFQGREKIAPPKGWSPVGESVAGPPKLDIETQKAIRASADEDIRQKHEYMLQQEKFEEERRREASRWYNYYYYPYGYSYGSYDAWTTDTLVSWGGYYSSYYSYSNGYYSYSGNSYYSGYGFSFGYADEDVSVSFGVYSY